MPERGHRSASQAACAPDAGSNLSRFWLDAHPRIVSHGDHHLHDRVQVLQPRRTAERLAAHIDVVGYRVVAAVDCIGEGVQSVGEIEFVPHHFAIVVCISELSMHTRVRPKAVREQLRV